MIESFKKYLIEDGKSENTIKNYIRNVKLFFKWLDETTGTDFNKLLRQNILDYRSYLITIKKDKARTINTKIAALIKFNEFLVDEKIQENIVVSKKDNIKIQEEVASPTDITRKEVEGFRQKVLEEKGNRDYAIVTLMAYAGLRISEVLNLKLDDIDLIAKEIIVKGKRDKYRLVYANQKIINSTKEYLKDRGKSKYKDSEYLFISNRGNRIARSGINMMFNEFSKKITPHTLRHFYCTNALESGFSIHEVANQAGHSNIHTTLRYTNPSREKMKEKADLL